jgi:hypothetical protein
MLALQVIPAFKCIFFSIEINHRVAVCDNKDEVSDPHSNDHEEKHTGNAITHTFQITCFIIFLFT